MVLINFELIVKKFNRISQLHPPPFRQDEANWTAWMEKWKKFSKKSNVKIKWKLTWREVTPRTVVGHWMPSAIVEAQRPFTTEHVRVCGSRSTETDVASSPFLPALLELTEQRSHRRPVVPPTHLHWPVRRSQTVPGTDPYPHSHGMHIAFPRCISKYVPREQRHWPKLWLKFKFWPHS